MRKGFTVIELLVVGFIVLTVMGILAGVIGSCVSNYSTGFRDGTVTKFSFKGVVYKSYEGELAMGIGVATSIWSFSVSSEEAAQDIQAIPPMTQVRLHYRQGVTLKRETEYDVYKVEIIHPPNSQPVPHAPYDRNQPAERQ